MLFANAASAAEKLKALAKAYGTSLPGRLNDLETLARPLSGGGPFGEIRQSLCAVCDLAHQIAGTAGTFGYQGVTVGARAIEESLRPVIAAERPLTAERAAGIKCQIEALKKLGSSKPGPGAFTDPVRDQPSKA